MTKQACWGRRNTSSFHIVFYVGTKDSLCHRKLKNGFMGVPKNLLKSRKYVPWITKDALLAYFGNTCVLTLDLNLRHVNDIFEISAQFIK